MNTAAPKPKTMDEIKVALAKLTPEEIDKLMVLVKLMSMYDDFDFEDGARTLFRDKLGESKAG